MSHIYNPHHQRQLAPGDPWGGYNCTAYAAAMFADAVTLGGSRVTGKQVRAWSNEPVPQPASPGLNIPQVVVVLHRLGIYAVDKTGRPWADVLSHLGAHRKVIAQISYAEIGSDRCQMADFGHAMLLTQHRDGQIRADDPLCKTAKWYPEAHIRAAMEKFGDETHVPGPGLRWATSRIVPLVG